MSSDDPRPTNHDPRLIEIVKKPLEVLRLYPEHDYTLNGAFASRARRDPRRPFILFGGKTWSWAEFGAAVEKTARLLVVRGVKKGDRVRIEISGIGTLDNPVVQGE